MRPVRARFSRRVQELPAQPRGRLGRRAREVPARLGCAGECLVQFWTIGSIGSGRRMPGVIEASDRGRERGRSRSSSASPSRDDRHDRGGGDQESYRAAGRDAHAITNGRTDGTCARAARTMRSAKSAAGWAAAPTQESTAPVLDSRPP